MASTLSLLATLAIPPPPPTAPSAPAPPSSSSTTGQSPRVPGHIWFLLDGRGPPPTWPTLLAKARRAVETERLDAAAREAYEADRKAAYEAVETRWGKRGENPPAAKELRSWYRERSGGLAGGSDQ